MRDRKAAPTWRQPQKRALPYRWKGFQRENAVFLFVDLGFSYWKTAELLGIPPSVVRNFVNRHVGKPKHKPRPWNGA